MESDQLLTAAWVAPMTRPIIQNGAILVRAGRIAAVGPLELLQRLHPSAIIRDLGNATILPGLVNAHTHLELSLIQRGNPPARFVDWIMGLMPKMGLIDPASQTKAGINQCLRFGVTTIGDITSQPALTRPILAQSPLGGISYGEVRAMGQRRTLLAPRLVAAIDSQQSRAVSARTDPNSDSDLDSDSDSGATRPGSVSSIQPGISPHAPYSIETTGYEKCLTAAREHGLPLATHLAETTDEAIFLADHTGPFKELWDFLNAWDEDVPTFPGGPIRFTSSIGLLEYPTLLAHVNYCDDAELALLAAGNASVVYCPRTHQFFGHPPHRWRDMLARGINVAVGTDSCASSPDLNPVDELRLLHNIAPKMDPQELWQLITVRGAKALGLSDLGSLSVGNRADFAVFLTTSDDPLREIIQLPQLPLEVWIAGQVVQPESCTKA